jgi:hypothetical protein
MSQFRVPETLLAASLAKRVNRVYFPISPSLHGRRPLPGSIGDDAPAAGELFAQASV